MNLEADIIVAIVAAIATVGSAGLAILPTLKRANVVAVDNNVLLRDIKSSIESLSARLDLHDARISSLERWALGSLTPNMRARIDGRTVKHVEQIGENR